MGSFRFISLENVCFSYMILLKKEWIDDAWSTFDNFEAQSLHGCS